MLNDTKSERTNINTQNKQSSYYKKITGDYASVVKIRNGVGISIAFLTFEYRIK